MPGVGSTGCSLSIPSASWLLWIGWFLGFLAFTGIRGFLGFFTSVDYLGFAWLLLEPMASSWLLCIGLDIAGCCSGFSNAVSELVSLVFLLFSPIPFCGFRGLLAFVVSFLRIFKGIELYTTTNNKVGV